ncbi:sensor histidine kinase [Runella slithyformis]|uniref:Signal transduction histidine kinase n=1 Tax=Runella slithyformis (strain ATCC 29530 / DSM 19594 / LMG 11500 / NCIMB 11436 / LSU 4) TaxID=761193 RepID=A0A7U4E8Y9_RUNSL|nr:histidine kinase [Runella slithyformis]AEI51969.1 putative signal transduction histidine kinase [Runella slithyformis DSM 19594]
MKTNQKTYKRQEATTLNDKWLRFVGVPILSIVGQWLFFDTPQLVVQDYPIVRYGINLIYSVSLWEVCRKIIIYSRTRYPNFEDNTKRLMLQLLGFVVSIFFIRTLLNSLLYFTIFTKGFDVFNFIYGAFITTLFLIPFAAVYEIIFFYQGWKVSNIEAEELRKMNLQSQLESIQAQINPHFLFNNLNTLSSLIQSDTGSAEQFLEELSSVYRYLLQKNQGRLSRLSEELSFVDSYIYILQMRFREAFVFEKNIAERWLSYQIPTHTLQVLLENAVRHNVISLKKPLNIKLFVEDGKLVCSNTFQKKNLTVATNQQGLNKIIQKYQLLSRQAVEIIANEQIFEVKLPLLNP